MLVQNNDPDMRTISSMGAGTAGNTSVSTTLNGGEKKVIAVTQGSACTSGLVYEYNVSITYNSADITGQRQIGTKPIIGKCV